MSVVSETLPSPNAEVMSFWENVMVEKYRRFRAVLVGATELHARRAFALHAPPAGARVLDVGCGFGEMTLHIAKRVGTRGEAVGLDWAAIDALWAGDAAAKDGAIQAVFDGYERGMAPLDVAARAYKALALKHGARLVTYEAAPGMQLPSTWPQGRLDLLQAVHRDPRMGTFLSGRYFPWLARYFDLIMYTQDCDRPSPGKFWAAKANADDNACPKWRACMEWCAGHNGR